MVAERKRIERSNVVEVKPCVRVQLRVPCERGRVTPDVHDSVWTTSGYGCDDVFAGPGPRWIQDHDRGRRQCLDTALDSPRGEPHLRQVIECLCAIGGGSPRELDAHDSAGRPDTVGQTRGEHSDTAIQIPADVAVPGTRPLGDHIAVHLCSTSMCLPESGGVERPFTARDELVRTPTTDYGLLGSRLRRGCTTCGCATPSRGSTTGT